MSYRIHYLSVLKAAPLRAGYRSSDGAIRKGMMDWILFRGYSGAGSSLDEFAGQIGVPREDITAFLQEYLGTRFLTLRKKLRIEDAKEHLLNSPELSLRRVAEMVGIQDRSDFRREFTEEVGCSPSEWRESRTGKK